MPVLKKFTKQVGELFDYDITFEDYLTPLADSIVEVVSVTVDTGLTLVSWSLIDDFVKLWVEGGTVGEIYYAEATVLTVGGRRRQGDISIKVIETGKAAVL